MNLANTNRLTATTLKNFEPLLEEELQALGAKNIVKDQRAISYDGDLEMILKSNLWLRTAIRVLKPLHKAKVLNEKELYKAIYKLNWAELIHPLQTFMIISVIQTDNFTNSLYTSLKAKDAIVDKIRKQTDQRPNVDKNNPDFTLLLFIRGEEMTLFLDTSGGSLHKRGYKTKIWRAPVSEVLAAGLIKLSNWDAQSPLIDPMCGSGTLITEAGLIAQNIAPGLFREKFGFEKLKHFDKSLWKELKKQAFSAIRMDDLPKILGLDIEKKAVQICRENIEQAGLMENVNAYMRDFFKSSKEFPSGTIICNPPYNERIGVQDVNSFYKRIGDTLKHKYKNYNAWILSGNEEAIKQIGLRTSKKLHLMNGKIPVKYHSFEVY